MHDYFKINNRNISKEYQPIEVSLNINNSSVQENKLILTNNDTVFIPLDKIVSYCKDDLILKKGWGKWNLYKNNEKYSLIIGSNIVKHDGQNLQLNYNIELINDMIYVPLEFVKNILNYNAIFNKDGQSIYIDNFGKNFDYSWVENNKYVAHAFGGIDGRSYTNSLEAFYHNYEKGHRVFEVDLSLTADNKLVAVHDWSINTIKNVLKIQLPLEKEGKPLTLSEFKMQKINGKYTPLSFEEIAELMNEYPDIYIVTDTKETIEELIRPQFEEMVKVSNKINISIMDRIIPQIYNNDMYDCIMKIHDFKSIIYTLYNQGNAFSYEDTLKFAYENGIKVITTYPHRASDEFLKELQDMGINIYMHTYNKEEDMLTWKEKGVHGFYTDFLTL